ncbi:hypothetical protein HEK616_63440 [Streptomyces nigrescens]|uniref:Uncharacterized protein n=1 Tax=Streptomyces nigrescens TaxID=1920 RepID=A0ABM8A2R2_STRNI|nr:hypothetical protein [Streptomyces nigrescens]BDM72857.1 hypothetical protein HEK616_63440 [Streptomyces nigrescens]
MTSATIPPASVPSFSSLASAPLHPAKGAPAPGAASAPGHRHPVGNALRAIRVFAAAAFSVAVLGEYADGRRAEG